MQRSRHKIRGAYQSPIWKCLPKLKSLVDSGKTWKVITETLNSEDAIDLTLSSVFNFWTRYVTRETPYPAKLRQAPKSNRLVIKTAEAPVQLEDV